MGYPVSARWDRPVRLHELARGPLSLRLELDAAERAVIARALKLEGLPSFSADITLRPWLDGAEITGRFRAVVEQICGVSLDAFEEVLEGEIAVQVVPAGSPNAPQDESAEVEFDLNAPDPPDVLAGDAIDVAGYIVEHLALAIDPFPRKPGATFDYTPPADVTSPFAALKDLTQPKP